MSEIKPYDVQVVQRTLEKSNRSSLTVNNCMDHLSHVFNAAVKDETINRNPCICIEPVRRTEKPARDTIHRALTREETKAFIQGAEESFYYNAFCLMLQTGLRIGELAALKEEDINDSKRVMYISKTVTRDEVGCYMIGDSAKTNAGTRMVPLTDQAIECIRRQRQQNLDYFGETADGTIFRSAEDRLLREYQVNREIKRICNRTGVEKFTCHALRATFATRFIEQRAQDYKILSEILGHSDIKITLNLYTHAMEDKKIQAMRELQFDI